MGSKVKKVVKKVTKPIKKVAKSPIGRAALLYAGTAGLGALGTGTGFAGFKQALLKPSLNLQNLLTTGKGFLTGVSGGAIQFPGAAVASSAPGAFSLGSGLGKILNKPGLTIGAISAASGLLAAKDQKTEEEIAAMSQEERNEYVAKLRAAYTANLSRGFPGIGSVPYTMAAEGGIMMASAPDTMDSLNDLSQMLFGKNLDQLTDDERDALDDYNQGLAKGGMPTGIMRTNAAGIKERDYRDEGGFVPVGVKEKADDVPAMLSKNEFVMTADAVRGAGNGSIEKGAQKMYDTMKKLEDKVA